MLYGFGCSVVFSVTIRLIVARNVRPCEGQVWQVASLTRYKYKIQADTQTEIISVDLQVACLEIP